MQHIWLKSCFISGNQYHSFLQQVCLDTVQTITILTKATSACGTGSLARTNCGTLTPAGSSVALWMLELLTPDSLALRNQWYLPVLLGG